jgi:hypothetical protein
MTDTTAQVVPTVDTEGDKFFGANYADPIIKFATDVYIGSLLLYWTNHDLPAGHTQITVSATKAIPEDIPKGFTASNLLEEILMANQAGFSQKIDFPVGYVRTDFWKGLAKNTRALPARYATNAFTVIRSSTKDQHGLRIELMSKKLNRAIYVDISSPG